VSVVTHGAVCNTMLLLPMYIHGICLVSFGYVLFGFYCVTNTVHEVELRKYEHGVIMSFA
jgi:hypothetical protein